MTRKSIRRVVLTSSSSSSSSSSALSLSEEMPKSSGIKRSNTLDDSDLSIDDSGTEEVVSRQKSPKRQTPGKLQIKLSTGTKGPKSMTNTPTKTISRSSTVAAVNVPSPESQMSDLSMDSDIDEIIPTNVEESDVSDSLSYR